MCPFLVAVDRFIHWRMVVVVGGNVLHHIKGNVRGGVCPGEMSRGEMYSTQRCVTCNLCKLSGTCNPVVEQISRVT